LDLNTLILKLTTLLHNSDFCKNGHISAVNNYSGASGVLGKARKAKLDFDWIGKECLSQDQAQTLVSQFKCPVCWSNHHMSSCETLKAVELIHHLQTLQDHSLQSVGPWSPCSQLWPSTSLVCTSSWRPSSPVCIKAFPHTTTGLRTNCRPHHQNGFPPLT
jgi:hypothetical protein